MASGHGQSEEAPRSSRVFDPLPALVWTVLPLGLPSAVRLKKCMWKLLSSPFLLAFPFNLTRLELMEGILAQVPPALLELPMTGHSHSFCALESPRWAWNLVAKGRGSCFGCALLPFGTQTNKKDDGNGLLCWLCWFFLLARA